MADLEVLPSNIGGKRMKSNVSMSTQKIVMAAMLTAIVVLFQFLGSFIKFGPFSISLVLVPIVIGAALCGIGVGAWLGLVFAAVVLYNDAGVFFAVSVPGTIITVVLKGVLCGISAGLVYKLLQSINKYLAVVISAFVCPVVNTGVFLICCRIFFMPLMLEWAKAANFGDDTLSYMILGLVGINFIIEMLINMILSPIIVRLLNARRITIAK